MNTDTMKSVGTVIKIAFARLRFIAIFVVAALLVGYWDTLANHWDKWTRPAPPTQTHAMHSDIEYYCPMHPNIIRADPGNCPICGMPLARRQKGQLTELPEHVLARVQLSPQRVAMAGVGTTAVAPRALVRDIGAVGVLDYDETRVAQLSARVAGRADQLFVQYAGQAVKEGQGIYSLYSPELYAAQREYLLARKRVNELPADVGKETRTDAAALYNATMEKLVLWGVGKGQLDAMDGEFDKTGKVPSHLVITSPISGIVIRKTIYEGSYVNVGDTPYTIADLGTLWLQAKIYERDVPQVQMGQVVKVGVAAMPGETFDGTVTFKSFQLDPQTRTLDARVEVKNPGLRLRPGMFADATIRVPVVAEHPTTVPATAPTRSPMDRARIFEKALEPYLAVQRMLAADKSEGASELFHKSLGELAPLSDDPEMAPLIEKLTPVVHKTMNQQIGPLRESFKSISSLMIEIGKAAGQPADAVGVAVYRCPMAKADWLQTGGETANPFYGAEMLTCGGQIEPLPKVAPGQTPATRPAGSAAPVLAVPRSAVIDTGRRKIAYVESAAGVYDMREVEVGVVAGEFYPVLAGLQSGDRVVTEGAFLVDAEDRLNPAAGHEH